MNDREYLVSAIDAILAIIDAPEEARALSDSGVNPFAVFEEGGPPCWCQADSELQDSLVPGSSAWLALYLIGALCILVPLAAVLAVVCYAIAQALGALLWLMASAL